MFERKLDGEGVHISGSTIRRLLESAPAAATAILGEGAEPCSYQALRELIDETGRVLNGLGLGRGDRVALVLPNGPEMAAAFLAIASAASAAPLNPAFKADEFRSAMEDLGIKALVAPAEAGPCAAAIEAARELAIPVLRLTPSGAAAGCFTLTCDGDRPSGPARATGAAEPGDVALLLHTSGTTSKPKMVPITHASLAASAGNIARTLALSGDDRGLNIMPLFHIHGLVAGLLAPLSRGGSVYCTSGFNALGFFRQMEAARPSWYTAVPTMHQAIVLRSAQHRALIGRQPLRFIRSSSAPLTSRLIADLEDAFAAPVIEAYGMTEAAHQISSNPLDGPRKAGSVGFAAGPEVAIMDPGGALLPAGETGEVVIRGETVMAAYGDNAEANARSFTRGWFRTGDQGRMDPDGRLWLTGRLKEIINRGGEKISPMEVDEALMDHPAVQSCVTFAVPHPSLGEDVGSAVVLHDGRKASAEELRAFLAPRMAAFKLPRTILFLDELPKGPTGKLQRIGLAARLGL